MRHYNQSYMSLAQPQLMRSSTPRKPATQLSCRTKVVDAIGVVLWAVAIPCLFSAGAMFTA